MTLEDVDSPPASDMFAVLRTKVQLWIVVVFMAIAFVTGMVMPLGGQPVPRPVDVPAADTGRVGPPPVAGPLTDEQLRAGLPANHPATAAGNGATPADAPTSPTTLPPG